MTYSERDRRAKNEQFLPPLTIRLNTQTQYNSHSFFAAATSGLSGCLRWWNVEWNILLVFCVHSQHWHAPRERIQSRHQSLDFFLRKEKVMNAEHPHRKAIRLSNAIAIMSVWSSLLRVIIFCESLAFDAGSELGVDYWTVIFGAVIAYSLIGMDVSPWINENIIAVSCFYFSEVFVAFLSFSSSLAAIRFKAGKWAKKKTIHGNRGKNTSA